jgi:hypothetical protein
MTEPGEQVLLGLGLRLSCSYSVYTRAATSLLVYSIVRFLSFIGALCLI